MSDSTDQPRSYAGLVSAILAALALLAKAHPEWRVVQLLAADIPNTSTILGYVIPGVALVVTSVTHPAHWIRDPLVAAWKRVTGTGA